MWGKRKLGQNEKLIRNLKIYEQKEKAEQQKPKVHGQKQVKRKSNKGKEINVHY